jgi:hypothetical protein
MTFSVTPSAQSGGGYLDVSYGSGAARFTVTEDAGHLRSFWGQLGREISRAEGVTPGQRAYTRYRAHTGGRSLASGDEIPEWDGLGDDIREAWEASARP